MIFHDITPPKKNIPRSVISLKRTAALFDKNKKKSGGKTPVQIKTRSIKLVVQDTISETSSRRIRDTSIILGVACAMLFIIIGIHLQRSGLRFKREIADAASLGFEQIISAATELQETNFGKAKKLFSEAERIFKTIENQTWFTSPKIPAITLKDPVFDSANSLIATGNYLSTAGALFAEVASRLEFLPEHFFEAQRNLKTEFQPSLTEQLKKELPNIALASELVIKANAEIKKNEETFIPGALRERFRFAKNAMEMLGSALQSFESDIPAILTLLGDTKPHTFLILLQNNAELRPSGGFIGNYLIVETNDGYITKNEAFDVYSADHQLVERIAAPPEIAEVNELWFLRDSNYSGHFPLSAEKAAWFLEKENGPGVDSVIAIDQTFIERLLELTGPIKIPELSQSLTSENFTQILSYIIESKISGREDPKAILKSFIPAFQKTFFGNTDPVSLIPVLREATEEKHLIAYSKDKTLEDFWRRLALSGEMKEADKKEDYLNIVHTSISGNKSDQYIAENIIHDTYLKSDGTVTNEVTITRTHAWNNEEENKLKKLIASFGFRAFDQKIIKILGGWDNVHMLRIYVPAGSTLENSSEDGVTEKFDEETNKTYFSLRTQTDLGKKKTITLRYKLPFKLNLDPVDKYQLAVQKQAGQDNITFMKRIFPESRVLNYKYFPENGAFDRDGVWQYETPLTKDMSFTSVWGK